MSLSKTAQATIANVFGDRCSLPGYTGETRGIVGFTDEFRRIEALPRYDFDSEDDTGDALIDAFRRPGSGMVPRRLQSVALSQLYENGGLLGSLPLGSGKTLITYLAAAVLGASYPLLLIPAHLLEKTRRDFEELSKHWDVLEPEIKTYQWISQVKQGEIQTEDGKIEPAWLDRFKPDLIIADEAHRLRRPGSACTRRVFRYLRDNLSVPFCALSGTLVGRSLLDLHKLAAIAMGPERMPLPILEAEVKLWARAVDEKVDIRSKPGALGMLLPKTETPSLDNVRRAVGRRIFETPGVVASDEAEVSAALVINPVNWKMPIDVKSHVRKLLDHSQAPNGDECTPSDVYRHLRSLALGFYYEWDPAPPWDWLDARRHWKRFVRHVLEQDVGFDSELQVANAAKRGEIPGDYWNAWDAVRHSYAGLSVPVWISDAQIERIEKAVDDSRTIVWVEQIAVGEYLAERTGWPYYHRQGKDRDGHFIDDHRIGPMIASIAANSEGRNLQAWSSAFVVTPPANGKTFEQMIGRQHRPGQTADEVHVDVLVPHIRIRNQFRQAIRDAELTAELTQQPQKLLIADYTRPV